MSEVARRRRIILVLMVKNESQIIQRCIEAAFPICDSFCIVDTGSSDRTLDAAGQILEFKGAAHWHIAHHDWVNFGHNRSLSFREGVDFCSTLGWDPQLTWALFLDADMVIKAGEQFSKDMCLRDAGYTVMQKQGQLEYYNLRLARMDMPWVCKGATHEYWEIQGAGEGGGGGGKERDDSAVETSTMSPELLVIEDVNDGGAKADKFERDIRLLLAEHEREPTNPRTLFYLAQSYQNSGQPDKAIPWYKKRLDVQGWHEEGWYAKLSLGRCYLAIGKPIDAEFWYMDCYEGNHYRAEPLYELSKHFRDVGDHFKAMHYCLKGLTIPKPSKGLFVDTEVYTWKLKFERTILDYYIMRSVDPRRSLESVMAFLADPRAQLKDQVFANLKFYIMPLIATTTVDDYISQQQLRPPITRPSLIRHNDECPVKYVPYNFPDRLETYTPSSMSIALHPTTGKCIANLRYVNYRIGNRVHNSGRDIYTHPPGSADTHRILTRNYLCELDPSTFDVVPGTLCTQPWHDFLPDHIPRHTERNVLGLEDLRMFQPAPEFTELFAQDDGSGGSSTSPASSASSTSSTSSTSSALPASPCSSTSPASPCSPCSSTSPASPCSPCSPHLLGFACAQMEYTTHGKIRIAMGLMDVDRFTCTHGAVVESPHGEEMWCEKNWIPLAGGREWIYSWRPLRIGRVTKSEGNLQLTLGAYEYPTPYIFVHLRGSSTPVLFRGQLWLVTHLKYLESDCMTYVHFLLVLDQHTYRPIRYSVPFFFRNEDVEFCTAFAISMAGHATFFFSQRDAHPARITCPLEDIPMIEI